MEKNGDKGVVQVNQGENIDIIEGAHASSNVSKFEKQRQEEVCNIPKTPRKDLAIFQSLEGEMEREASLSPKPKKKSYREPSMASPVETRISCKLDAGPQSRRGRRSEKQTREEETKRSLADGR